MDTIFFVSWIGGILFSILMAIVGFWIKEKELFNLSGWFFVLSLLTGYITFFPVLGVLIVFLIQSRFNEEIK